MKRVAVFVLVFAATVQSLYAQPFRRSSEPECERAVWGNLFRVNLRGCSLVEADMANAVLNAADLRDADLRSAVLSRSSFTQTDLRNADLSFSNLRNCTFRLADIRGANLEGADLTEAVLAEAYLQDSNLENAVLRGAVIHGAFLGRANLRGADLSMADLATLPRAARRSQNFTRLSGAILVDADLQSADLRGVDFTGADFLNANLTEANLSGANLRGANFEGAILTGAHFVGADLEGATLAGADLTGVDFRGAQGLNSAGSQGEPAFMPSDEACELVGEGVYLSHANLSGCDLAGRNISESDLTGSSLRNADLSAANLSKTLMVDVDLAGATLVDSDLRGAELGGVNLLSVNLGEASAEGFHPGQNVIDAETDLVGVVGLHLEQRENDSWYWQIGEGSFFGRGDSPFRGSVPFHMPDFLRCDTFGPDGQLNVKSWWYGGRLITPSDGLGMYFREKNFSGCNFENADFRGVMLHGSNFSGANLSGADLRGGADAEMNFRGADLSNADLRGTFLMNTDFSYANLSGADLSDAHLQEAQFTRADLRRAIFIGARLNQVDFTQSDLRGAMGINFSGAAPGIPAYWPEDVDDDEDGVPNFDDICPGHDDRVDGDGDGIPDGCDEFPEDALIENDICPGAIELVFEERADDNGTVLLSSVANGSTSMATVDAENASCMPSSAPGVWYSFVGMGPTIISTCSEGSNYDTALSIFKGDCSELVCAGANDDSCALPDSGRVLSTISLDAEEGGNYLVLVHGWGSTSGDYTLSVNIHLPQLEDSFLRGDANADGGFDISDASYILNFLFLGAGAPFCYDAVDVNDDGRLDLSDAVSILNRLFLGGLEIPPPGVFDCGTDPTEDGFDCERFPSCEN